LKFPQLAIISWWKKIQLSDIVVSWTFSELSSSQLRQTELRDWCDGTRHWYIIKSLHSSLSLLPESALNKIEWTEQHKSIIICSLKQPFSRHASTDWAGGINYQLKFWIK
jgi:hypothetical protein